MEINPKLIPIASTIEMILDDYVDKSENQFNFDVKVGISPSKIMIKRKEGWMPERWIKVNVNMSNWERKDPISKNIRGYFTTDVTMKDAVENINVTEAFSRIYKLTKFKLHDFIKVENYFTVQLRLLEDPPIKNESLLNHIKSFKKFEGVKVDYDNTLSHIRDCMEELDFIDDEIPFTWRIKTRPVRVLYNGGMLCTTIFESKYHKVQHNKQYFTVSDYNKYILPVIKRILKNNSILIFRYNIRILLDNIFNKFGYDSTYYINKKNGEWRLPVDLKPEDSSIKIQQIDISFEIHR